MLTKMFIYFLAAVAALGLPFSVFKYPMHFPYIYAAMVLLAVIFRIKKRRILYLFFLMLIVTAPVVLAFLSLKTLYFVFPAAAVLFFSGVSVYENTWAKKVLRSSERRGTTQKDMETLKERFNARMESLHYLENQVGGLMKLFEMARDFNECLGFSDLISVVDEKISKEAQFERGSIILFERNGKTQDDSSAVEVNLVLPFGRNKRAESGDLDLFAKDCIKLLGNSTSVVKIEGNEADVNLELETPAQLPMWLFPLAVEHQVIALLAIEGAVVNDFPKFEILASQLALQIKKIRLYETVKEISIIDGLTQVFVRRHFLERFQEELKRAMRYSFPLSVLMVDVDHFKSYNDKFGHLVGDKALRHVAQLIRENIRRVDVIGRYGGEEFIVVAPEINKEQCAELAERIRSSIARRHLQIFNEETQMTVSIGAVSFPEDIGTQVTVDRIENCMTELVEKADMALYRAKEDGRNRVMMYGF